MPKSERRAEAVWSNNEKRWTIRVQADGERRAFHSSTSGRRGKHEAEAIADKWLESRTKDVRLLAAWAEYLAYQKEHNGRSNYSLQEYIGRTYILPPIGDKYISRITPVDWQKCIDKAEKSGLSKRSCINVRAAISSFITYARRRRWAVDRLERGDIVIPKNAPRAKKKVLQPDDLQTLFTQDAVRIYKLDRPAFFIFAWRFLVLTGLREGELCGLRTDDIDGETLHIRRAVNKFGEETLGKNENALRAFVLSKAAQQVLRAQRAMLAERGMISGWLFPDENGERLDPRHLYTKWLTYRKQHGISVTIHELRHTFISAVMNDMPEPLLKASVGHSESMDTIGVYGHEITGEMHRAAEIVDTVFSRLLASKQRPHSRP